MESFISWRNRKIFESSEYNSFLNLLTSSQDDVFNTALILLSSQPNLNTQEVKEFINARKNTNIEDNSKYSETSNFTLYVGDKRTSSIVLNSLFSKFIDDLKSENIFMQIGCNVLITSDVTKSVQDFYIMSDPNSNIKIEFKNVKELQNLKSFTIFFNSSIDISNIKLPNLEEFSLDSFYKSFNQDLNLLSNMLSSSKSSIKTLNIEVGNETDLDKILKINKFNNITSLKIEGDGRSNISLESLEKVSKYFKNLKRLEVYCDVPDVEFPYDSFKFPTLKTLILWTDNIQIVDEEIFRNLPNLSELSIGDLKTSEALNVLYSKEVTNKVKLNTHVW